MGKSYQIFNGLSYPSSNADEFDENRFYETNEDEDDEYNLLDLIHPASEGADIQQKETTPEPEFVKSSTGREYALLDWKSTAFKPQVFDDQEEDLDDSELEDED